MILTRGVAARPALADGLRVAGLATAARRVLDSRSAGRAVMSVVAPFAVRARGVRRVKDVPYGEHGRPNLLDVYRPTSRRRPAPMLVYFHGGGYFSGRKSKEARLLLYRLARRGWLCISANYRLRPTAGFEDHLADLGKVLAWVRTNAADHGGDPPPDCPRRELRGRAKCAGLRDIRWHDLRHTCATLRLGRGVHRKLVQHLLGHASITMTLDRYSH